MKTTTRVLLLACELRLPAIDAALSRTTAQALRRHAITQHVVHGVPLVLANLMLHSSVPWDPTATYILLVSVATLVFVLPWQILELSRPRNMAFQVESAEDV